ncbi:MAG TPA: MFS transporter [Pseudonocardiaceae bacterium]|nr:MFS transporter [Pseudonocardiaceae bacterium]
MSTAPTRISTHDDPAPARFGALRHLSVAGRRAFVGAFGGYGLDAFDYQVLPLTLSAIAAYFRISAGQAGLLNSVTLVVSAVGGLLAGVLADRIGRTRTLMITIGTYAVFTLLCGLAPNFGLLLTFRALQGLGFGGEWAVGAVLVAEYAAPRYRGRVAALIQSSWAVGWAAAVVVYAIVFDLASPEVGWRIMFMTGVLPALFVLYLRRKVSDAPRSEGAGRSPNRIRAWGSVSAIMRGGLGRTTFFAALLATGVQGGYYTLGTWLPLYLHTARHLNVVNTGGYLAFLISGAFAGYLFGGVLSDRIGRKANFAIFAVAAAVLLVAYSLVPPGANGLLLVLGFPLGFAYSAIFSGFGAFLAELYPAELRGTGQGFTYNFGRAVGASFPATVGFMAEKFGIGGAMAFGALGYAIAVVALLGLPETRGRELR